MSGKLHDVNSDFLQGWEIKGHLILFVLLVFTKVSTVNMCGLLIGGWCSDNSLHPLTGTDPTSTAGGPV